MVVTETLLTKRNEQIENFFNLKLLLIELEVKKIMLILKEKNVRFFTLIISIKVFNLALKVKFLIR